MAFNHNIDNPSRALWLRGSSVALAVLLAAGLAACDKKPGEPSAGQKLDAAVEKTENAAERAKVEAETAANDAKAKMESAAQDASAAARSAASNAAAALDDTAITTKVKAAFAADPNLSAVLISVDTKDGVVKLSGPVKTPDDAAHAERLTQAVEGVKSVVNELKPSNG
ncbi:BON domain-containing protein [Diaphorobacter ruginosibacter]|jgi:osmotically-inducible protein OsmY|uniref:BON domain-containing protein n=1 Tax=Diaphorobacter ruginosibacter TaxID=1715720 RepID=A0A7G9RIE2_9BURK|nr:BON domain-containing protein [Diaphorobacter ruginosibacter]MDR2332765.1 BON domain-containing protein [Burkholderiaceae bacterium]QNN55367.1 BON domain-containing protein [Diaphorobacter ruginosibacter]